MESSKRVFRSGFRRVGWPSRQIFNSFAAAENARCTRVFFSHGQLFVVHKEVNLQVAYSCGSSFHF